MQAYKNTLNLMQGRGTVIIVNQDLNTVHLKKEKHLKYTSEKHEGKQNQKSMHFSYRNVLLM